MPHFHNFVKAGSPYPLDMSDLLYRVERRDYQEESSMTPLQAPQIGTDGIGSDPGAILPVEPWGAEQFLDEKDRKSLQNLDWASIIRLSIKSRLGAYKQTRTKAKTTNTDNTTTNTNTNNHHDSDS